ncbi:MAG: UvrD-helicase domain-containing protein [Spirochaetota bacterium]
MSRSESITAGQIVDSGYHAFVEASAGSGKTTLLTSLFREIISTGRAEIGQILCVTFTEKAASELKAKVYRELTSQPGNESCRRAVAKFAENQIGTIHSFCLRSLALAPIARLAENTAEGDGDSEIFEEAREWVYRTCWAELAPAQLARLLAEVKFGSGGQQRQFDADLKQKALWCFASGSAPIVPLAEEKHAVVDAASFKAWTLFRTVQKMRELAAQRNQMTFSRMITGLAEALSDEKYARQIRGLFAYALIDEFQDTDAVQWNIFRTLFLSGQSTARLVVVGDPKQAIYKFRGADVFVYLAARRELEQLGALMGQLATNYRSNETLLGFQNWLFSGPGPVSVWSPAEIVYHEPVCGRAGETAAPGDTVEIFSAAEYSSAALEVFAAAAIERVAELRTANPAWTCAIIAYRHRSLQVFAEALRSAGIEFSYYKQQPDFGRTEVEHLKSLLYSLTLDADEGLAISESTLFLRSRPDSSTWYYRLHQLGRDGRIVSLLTSIAQDSHLLHRVLECGGDTTHYYAWRTLIQTLLTACGRAVHDLDSLLQYLENLSAGDEDNPAAADILRDHSAVTLLTVQSAKGLDWNIVVVADGHNDNRWANFAFFHDRSGEAVVPADIEDFIRRGDFLLEPETEARITQLNLLYVAMTRAKDRLLFLSAPNSRSQKPGPMAFFLGSVEAGSVPAGTSVHELGPAKPIRRGAIGRAIPEPEPVEHGNIPLRYGERTSFTALSDAHFTETEFIDDILPRGAGTGQLLHNFLETADLAALGTNHADYSAATLLKIMTAVREQITDTDTLVEPIARRILSIIHATATARLTMPDGHSVRLCDIPTDNLWREMPFWSSRQIHRILQEKNDSVRRIMHGYMDLVFTPDGANYFILDYKSNSLSGVEPALIGRYVDEHYGLQAQIYAEALDAYLQIHYPGTGRRVLGCYFVFMRYLAPDSATGVHFIDVSALKT